MSSESEEAFTKRSARRGRILLTLTGTVLTAVGAALWFLAPGAFGPMPIIAVVAGVAELLTAAFGSDRACSRFGIFAVWMPSK